MARVELRWREVTGPTNHAFILLWETDSKGNKVGAPRYFGGYQGNGFAPARFNPLSKAFPLTARFGYYTGPQGKQLGAPDWDYRPGGAQSSALKGSLLIADDCKPASDYAARFKAVAQRVNAAGFDYPWLGAGVNSNTVARLYVELGLGVPLLSRLSSSEKNSLVAIDNYFPGLDKLPRSWSGD